MVVNHWESLQQKVENFHILKNADFNFKNGKKEQQTVFTSHLEYIF